MNDNSPKVKWNPGKKVHQVLKGNEVIYENSDKTKAQAVAAA